MKSSYKQINKLLSNYFKDFNYKDPKKLAIYGGLGVIALVMLNFIIVVLVKLLFIGFAVALVVWLYQSMKKKDVDR